MDELSIFPPNCKGDVEIIVMGLLFEVKIRKLLMTDYGNPDPTEIPVFHIGLYPLLSTEQYELWCEKATDITDILFKQVADICRKAAPFAIINMAEWSEFIQY